MNDSLILKLQARELDTIANALAQRPWGEVNALLVNIQQQVTQQQQEPPNVQPDAPEPDAPAGPTLRAA
jgi:hypothetical protein